MRNPDARTVRETVARAFSLRPERLILAPGILAGLKLVLPPLGIRKMLLGGHEYFDRSHFPEIRAQIVRGGPLRSAVRRFRPDAVLLSRVSYDGVVLDLRKIFGGLRHELGRSCPLLIADATHAAAVGDFRLDSLGADLVCGDAAKWLLPPPFPSGLAYLWPSSARLFRRIRPSFAPFFLSVEGVPGRQAQLLSLADLHRAARWFRQERPTRAKLIRRHAENLRLASSLKRSVGTESAIVVLDATEESGLRRHPLAWTLPDGRIRVLCRSELIGGNGRCPPSYWKKV